MSETKTYWAPVMIKSDVKDKLQEIMKRENISSISKAIDWLISQR